MRGVVVTHTAAGRALELRILPEPVAGAGDAVVRMKATSLNLGEVKRSLTMAEDGHRPGWDVAGVVERAAADGSGPAVGTRVAGFIESGAWAELVALPARRLAPIPDGVSFEQAATLPVAGLTAWYALSQGGLLAGRRVLINGASGGVGHLACQIARASGARVTAVVRRAERAATLEGPGIRVVVAPEGLGSAAEFGPYDVILDSVGGADLSAAIALVGTAGVCVTFGDAGTDPAAFHPRPLFRNGGRICGLFVHDEVQRDPPAPPLAAMMQLIEDGLLQPEIQVCAPWEKIDALGRDLMERRIAGKAVLTIG